jgi:WhiB family redox-sensing transcriptional regulator
MTAHRRLVARAASLGEVVGIDVQATEWMRDGLCAQTDPDAFHPDENVSVKPAKAVCAVCPVVAQCRSYALETDQRFGVWGGLSARERQQISKSTRPDAHPAKNVRRVGAPNTQQSGENPMVGTAKLRSSNGIVLGACAYNSGIRVGGCDA